jgi:hypothetical protein
MQQTSTARRWLVLGVAVVTGLVACQSSDQREVAKVGVFAPGTRANTFGCFAGGKFTGGGRVDPIGVGKVTFGFNIHGEDCDQGTAKGNIQVVYHENQTLVHSLTEERFNSWEDPERGACAEWEGVARVKHVDAGEDWHEHGYLVRVCDKAEPGHGADRFSFYLDAAGDGLHHNVEDELLTGGNIQAHKN